MALAHYRDFQLVVDPRIASLLLAVQELPEFQNGSCSEEEVIVP